jgi:putative flavoprotein involved in K+ transport
MTTDAESGDAPIVVIGAGQSGLATGYHLQQAGVEFTILADDERVGDTWRDRWDSLELFTPAFYSGLPGLDFPADDPEHLPHKDEMADYLERYAETFELPIELETRVTRLAHGDGRFVVETTAGERTADQVVVATGAHSSPWFPPFADELPDDVFACHSSEYRNPDQLPDGDVLVVGAGNSGTQIAAEIAADGDRAVWLAGRDTGRLPRRLLGRDIYRWIGPTLLRVSRHGFIGRRLYERTAHTGDPVFSDQFERMQAAGVERVDRIAGLDDGRPVTADGEAFDVDSVVWATGFRPHYPWIDLDVFDESGEPRHVRGVVEEAPGLYFVGLHWQSRPESSLTGGVGPDAAHVARQVHDARS